MDNGVSEMEIVEIVELIRPVAMFQWSGVFHRGRHILTKDTYTDTEVNK